MIPNTESYESVTSRTVQCVQASPSSLESMAPTLRDYRDAAPDTDDTLRGVALDLPPAPELDFGDTDDLANLDSRGWVS